MTRLLTAVVLALALASCSATRSPRPRSVESDLRAAGFRAVMPDTPKKQEAIKRLQPHQLTQVSRRGKPYYWYVDLEGCGCAYVGSEAAYRRYDALAEARDNVKSDTADHRMLGGVEADEEAPPDAWFWQDTLPEYFPQ
jgi:hypothetical protein